MFTCMKYSAAIGSRQTNSSSFHPRSVDPSDSISECSIVAIPFAVTIPFAVAIPFGNRNWCGEDHILACIYNSRASKVSKILSPKYVFWWATSFIF